MALITNGTAIILAGGKSSRMGQPKALLPFDDEPLILHIARLLSRIFSDIVVVAAPEQQLPDLPARIARDQVAYQGPVSGIYHGLTAADGEFSFVTSCDAPFLNTALISYLAAQITGYDVVVPFCRERYQPLHAVYRKSVLPFLEQQLERGELRPIFLFDKVRTRKIEPPEMEKLDPDSLSFMNMNTLQDYQAAVKRWREWKQKGAPVDSQKMATARPGASGDLVCVVELFGTARLLAKTKSVSLSLSPGATLSAVFSALAKEFPVLVGRVITPEQTRLAGGFTCNINGLAFVRDSGAEVVSGDRILILSADTGG